jgi:pimeloyl-ACP methyl ester carboxylesterase
VLIHGVGSHWQVWRPVLDELARRRDVIALDLPGFGASPTLPIGVVPNAAALTDAVAAFLDELGLERPVVGGNSLGGWVALELAKRGRARAVVGVSPAGFFTPWERRLSRAHLRSTQRTVAAAPALVEWLLRRPRGRALSLGGVVGAPVRMPNGDALEMIRNARSSVGFDPTLNAITRERFSGGEQVRVPVTLLWGTRDMVLLPRQAKRALAELPDARHVPLPGAGHVPMWDDPRTIARELLAA